MVLGWGGGRGKGRKLPGFCGARAGDGAGSADAGGKGGQRGRGYPLKGREWGRGAGERKWGSLEKNGGQGERD